MDNNEVYALFEDIRNGLKGINDKLENAPKISNSQSGEQAPAMDLAPIKACSTVPQRSISSRRKPC